MDYTNIIAILIYCIAIIILIGEHSSLKKEKKVLEKKREIIEIIRDKQKKRIAELDKIVEELATQSEMMNKAINHILENPEQIKEFLDLVGVAKQTTH